jgi:pyrimidine operon attenuation protein / uracil phosphoribosyltransferase
MSARAPDAEELLQRLAGQMRATVHPRSALIGIHTGGVWVAQRLHRIFELQVPLGTIDIAFYRDDYGSRGLSGNVRPSAIPFNVSEYDIVLVDDVLYTGRTIRAALNELFDYGRPGRVRLAALVDRGGRQLPICPQFVGGSVELREEEQIELKQAADGTLSLKIESRAARGSA